MLQRTSANAAKLLFQLVLDSRVTLGQGRVAGPAAWPGRAAQPEQGAVLQHWKASPWHRAGGQASWDRELSQTHTQPWQQGAGRAEAWKYAYCQLLAFCWKQLLGSQGPLVVSILFSRSCTLGQWRGWGRESRRIVKFSLLVSLKLMSKLPRWGKWGRRRNPT